AGSDRNFTVVFFTDGQPTIGESDPEKILKNVKDRNTTSTRIFTFGVGDDVNAALLDQLADQTRSVSTYVRPQEDIEVKVGGLYSKISHPVLTDLKLACTKEVKISEMYPTKLPDLFHGGQLVILGRYRGHGPCALTLTGKADKEGREFIYKVEFPEKTSGDKAFVEALWARRKVGYLLDEIRSHGEKKELIDEVVRLAKKNGITTPYTSYLVVPDNVAPAAPVVNGTPITPVPADPSAGPDRVFRSIQLRETTINSAPSSPAPSMTYAPVLSAPKTPTGQNIVGTPFYTAAPQPAAAAPPAGATSVSPASAPAPDTTASVHIFERGGKSESAQTPLKPLPTGGTVGGYTFSSTYTNASTVPLPQAGKEGVGPPAPPGTPRHKKRLGEAPPGRAARRPLLP